MSRTRPARPGRRTATRMVLAALIALVGLTLSVGPASAHTELLSSDPAQGSVVASAPAAATLTFNETIRTVPSAFHLYGADGKELTSTPQGTDNKVVIDLPNLLAKGTYTLAWRVISADGHPVAGALSFSVGAPSTEVVAPSGVTDPGTTAVQVAITVTQVAVYLGVFLAVGLMVFSRLLLPRTDGSADVRERLLKVARRGADLGFVASILLLPLTTINQRGDELSEIFAARSWQIDLSHPEPQVAGLLFVGLALAVATYGPGRLGAVAPYVGATMALGSLALVGHTRSFDPVALLVVTDLVHVLAGSVWFGGLVGLTLSLKHLASAPDLAARAVSRFSSVAAGLLGAVAVTGTILAWRILGSWGGFLHTSFGRTLLVKLGIVAVVLVLAALNRWRLLPAVLALARQGDSAGATAAIGRLRRAVRVEGLLLVAVLAVTGVLVDRSPEPSTDAASSSAPAGPVQATGEAPGINVALHIDPARIGSNQVELVITDGSSAPLTPLDPPTITFDHGDLHLDGQPLLEHVPGTYHGDVVLPKRGSWRAQVTVRTSEFDSRVIPITFEVG